MEKKIFCGSFGDFEKIHGCSDSELEERKNIYIGRYNYIRGISIEEVSKISYKDLKRIWRYIPIAERRMPIALVDKKVFTWKQCLEELKKGGVLAEKIQQKLGEI